MLQSVDRRAKQSYSYIVQMLYNHLYRFRVLLIILGLAMLLIMVKRFYSDLPTDVSENDDIQPSNTATKESKITQKIVEINDRQPSYKLYVYEGYQVAVDRNRAQAKILDNIKLHDTCQQNPKTLVVDVGASLGIVLKIFL
jgi:hypothetical protein